MRYSNALVSLIVSSLLVEIATFFAVPLSSTQTLTSSVFGVGISGRKSGMHMLYRNMSGEQVKVQHHAGTALPE